MVFSTIHTNSSAETITRAMNLGAKAFMIAGTFNFVMAQRLIRKSCVACSTDIDFSEDKQYTFAKETLMKMNKDVLSSELKKR
ncbi:hypothetical protein KA478_01200 [Patescibacteria group bacterium]|nr:hypothetical protein [Patescibacteria group bacterium]